MINISLMKMIALMSLIFFLYIIENIFIFIFLICKKRIY